MRKFNELTNYQKSQVTNGCGARNSWIKPPNFIFKASCDHHDYLFWVGCTEEDRLQADQKFYKKMREDISDGVWWKRPHRHALALSYYLAVRVGGKSAFYYGDKPRDIDEHFYDIKVDNELA